MPVGGRTTSREFRKKLRAEDVDLAIADKGDDTVNDSRLASQLEHAGFGNADPLNLVQQPRPWRAICLQFE